MAVAWMERSAVRGFADAGAPHSASLHAGYEVYLCGPDSEMSRSARKTLL